MTRPPKQTVNYFPHIINKGKTLFIIEEKFGNNGYAFWFKLLELLGSTEGHYIDCNNKNTWYYLLSRTKVNENMAIEILNILSDLEAIDNKLWKNKIIWCQKFVDNISDVYERRKTNIPQKPVLDDISVSRNSSQGGFMLTETDKNSFIKEFPSTETDKLNNIKLNNIKSDNIYSEANKLPHPTRQINPYLEPSQKIIDYLNKIGSRNFKYTPGNLNPIQSRLREGFTIEDCFKVIDNKWNDNDFNKKYFRPSTLFRPSKFEGYLQETKNDNRKKIEPKSLQSLREFGEKHKEILDDS